MFISPYLAWLGIMLTSKPNDLQSRLNLINAPRPQVTTTERASTPTSTMQVPIVDFYICAGPGRYPHSQDCSKYFMCTGEHEIVRARQCKRGLHFSPTALLCTVPRDAGCIANQTTTETPSVTTTGSSDTTPTPNWVMSIRSAGYYRALEEERLVIYYDRFVLNPRSVMWPITFIRNLWNSVLRYGNFGEGNRLYVVLRGRPQASTLNFASHLDSSKDFVNGIEVGSSDWSVEDATNTDAIALNLAHILVQSARGFRYSAAEPGWAEVFVYDMYHRTNQIANRDRWATLAKTQEEANVGSIPMFAEWYMPIYDMYGGIHGAPVLDNFLMLRARLFPKSESDSNTFAREMNKGEFIHFWSGSSNMNLTNLGTSVFRWSTALSAQYNQARIDFSSISYN